MKLNITNVTHSNYLHGKKLINVGIDPKDGRNVNLVNFNKTINLDNMNKVTELQDLTNKIKDKNPVLNEEGLLDGLIKQAEKDNISINNIKETKWDLIFKVSEITEKIKNQ